MVSCVTKPPFQKGGFVTGNSRLQAYPYILSLWGLPEAPAIVPGRGRSIHPKALISARNAEKTASNLRMAASSNL